MTQVERKRQQIKDQLFILFTNSTTIDINFISAVVAPHTWDLLALNITLSEDLWEGWTNGTLNNNS